MPHPNKKHSKYKGVTRLLREQNQANPWLARLNVGGRRYSAGQHPTEEAAALAYNELFMALLPEMLNKVEVTK